MAVEFQMPKLGLTMEEGTITAWLVDSGTAVEAGTAVLSIETDKVESDVEASHSGILQITGGVGELFECGERIGWFLEPGEAPPVADPAASSTQEPARGNAGTGTAPGDAPLRAGRPTT
ncbi:MAG: biotin/lipoyl-containing protein, partial [Microthrixaceae bacterium]